MENGGGSHLLVKIKKIKSILNKHLFPIIQIMLNSLFNQVAYLNSGLGNGSMVILCVSGFHLMCSSTIVICNEISVSRFISCANSLSISVSL